MHSRRLAMRNKAMYSYLASPKATIDVLQQFGLYTKKKLGQHFLVDDNVIAHILALADIQPTDCVIEVGPGIGTLTTALVESGARVTAVEFDADLPAVLQRTIVEHHGEKADTNFALVRGDAAHLSTEKLAAPFGVPTMLVSNLPYQVAATIVLRYFEIFESMTSATVMVQTEVAQRMAAQPGNKNYGAYTAKLNLLARATDSFAVSRQSFMPPPRVESTVIRLDRKTLVASLDEYAAIARVIDAAFAQRRKTLRNNLKSSLSLSSNALETACAQAGIDPAARAETLTVEEFMALSQALEMH